MMATPSGFSTLGVRLCHMYQTSVSTCHAELNLWYQVSAACCTLSQRQWPSFNPFMHGYTLSRPEFDVHATQAPGVKCRSLFTHGASSLPLENSNCTCQFLLSRVVASTPCFVKGS